MVSPRDGAGHPLHADVEHVKIVPRAVVDGRDLPPSVEVHRMEPDRYALRVISDALAERLQDGFLADPEPQEIGLRQVAFARVRQLVGREDVGHLIAGQAD